MFFVVFTCIPCGVSRLQGSVLFSLCILLTKWKCTCFLLLFQNGRKLSENRKKSNVAANLHKRKNAWRSFCNILFVFSPLWNLPKCIQRQKYACSLYCFGSTVVLRSCHLNKNASVKVLQPLVQEMWSFVMWVLCVFGGLVIAELSQFGMQKLLGVSSEKWEFTSDSQCHLQTTANWHCSERIKGP